METHEFMDKLYQLWAATTYAKDRYWDYQPTDDADLQQINAVGENGESIPIAWGLFEPDADFITAMHGCFPDVYRVVNESLDEADRADHDRDSRECRIAELELEVAQLRKVVDGLSKEPPWTNHDVHAE